MGMLNIVAQAGALSVLSNVLAQSITNYREQKPFTNLDLHEILVFVTYAVLNTPLNVYWQHWLEDTFPGTKPVAVPVKDEDPDEKPESVGVRDRMGVKEVTDYKNIAIKFALDQTVGAVFNIVLFIVGIGALKGEGRQHILASIRRDSLDIYVAGAKLWPTVSVISFLAIPVQKRVTFGSVVGVFWDFRSKTLGRPWQTEI